MCLFFYLVIRHHPSFKRTDTLSHCSTLVCSPFLLHTTLRPLMHTLVLAGAVTWLAVALSMHFLDPGHVLLGWILLLVFLAAFLSEILLREGHEIGRASRRQRVCQHV